MLTVIGLIALGASLGLFRFPAFALMAVALSILYSFFNFTGTISGWIADLLEALAALQLGYFVVVAATILYRRVHIARHNDQ